VYILLQSRNHVFFDILDKLRAECLNNEVYLSPLFANATTRKLVNPVYVVELARREEGAAFCNLNGGER
jgi:hypothetical protein